MKPYRDERGLVNARIDEKNGENSPLFTVEYIFLCKLNGTDCREEEEALNKFYESCKIRKGLYNQRPDNNGSHDDYMSHDQLTAMLCFFLYRGAFHKVIEVVEEIDRQKGHYDNINPEDPSRPLRPYDRWFYEHLLGRCNWFKWMVVSVAQKYSCKKVYKVRPVWYDRVIFFFKNFKFQEKRKMVHTDGKLLGFVKVHAFMACMVTDDRIQDLWDSIDKIIKKHEVFKNGGWYRVWKTYFPFTDHPNTIEAGKMWGVTTWEEQK